MDHDHSQHHMHHQPVVNVTSTVAPSIHDHHDHGSMDHGSMDHGSMDHGSMDHGMDHSNTAGAAVNHAMHHMMEMAFHGGCDETILFKQWSINSVSGLIWSMLAIFLLGVFYEALKYYRENLFWKSYNSLQYRAVSAPEKNGTPETDDSRVVQPTIFSVMHLYQSFLHLIQVTLSLMLMLIFMTYNSWLCFAVVFGAMVGYFLFGWKKSVVVDVTEHCH